MHDIAYLLSVTNTSFVEEFPSKMLPSSAIVTDFNSWASFSQLGIVELQRERALDGHLDTEEDEVIICLWMDCLLKRESDESSSSGIRNYNKDPQWNENRDFHSDREPTSDESSWEDYEACSDDLEIISKEGAPAVPRTAFQTHIRNVAICRKENSSVGSGTDDIGDLADFSSDEEESQVEQITGCRIPGCQCEGSIEYMEWDSDDLSDSEDSE